LSDTISISQCQTRLRFAAYLCSQGVRTLAPVLSQNNNVLETISFQGKHYFAFAWQKVAGKPLQDEHPRHLQDFYLSWGKTLGQMHLLSSTSQDFCADSISSANPVPHWSHEWKHFYHWIGKDKISNTWQQVYEQLLNYPQTKANFGMIHNDLHPKNMLIDDHGFTIIDFDVACCHWFVLDIAICIYSEYSRIGFHSQHRIPKEELFDLFLIPFLKGYHYCFRLPHDEYENIEFWLNYRRIIMYTVFYEQIKAANPAYLDRFQNDIYTWQPFLDRKLALV